MLAKQRGVVQWNVRGRQGEKRFAELPWLCVQDLMATIEAQKDKLGLLTKQWQSYALIV